MLESEGVPDRTGWQGAWSTALASMSSLDRRVPVAALGMAAGFVRMSLPARWRNNGGGKRTFTAGIFTDGL